MKKSILTLSTFVALTSSVTFAQQEKLLTHFIYDKMSINPAATGLEQGICGTMAYRNQWDKVNGAPNSVLFNLEADLSNLSNTVPGAVGVSFYHDAIGEMRQNNLLLNYSLPITVNLNGAYRGTMSVGFGLGLVNVGFDPAWVPPVTLQDPLLPIKTAGGAMDMNLGLLWRGNANATRPYYVGFSMTHLNQAVVTNSVSATYSNARHMFLIGGYSMYNVFGDGRSLDFQMLGRTDMVKYSAELNVRYLHQLSQAKLDHVYAGITTRAADGVGVMLGYVKQNALSKMTIGYSYDLTLNKLRDISKGSHEIVIRYVKLIPPPPLQKSKHPRWL